MRTLAFSSMLVASVLTGCLSAPTGRDPATIDAAPIDAIDTSWPPSLANIIAMGAGDLDVDNFDDIIAVDQTTARVYFLRATADIVSTSANVLTHTRSAALAGARAPAAVIVARNGVDRFVVVLDNPTAGPRLTIYDDQLTMLSQTTAGNTPAPVGSAVTLAQTGFGMGQLAVFGSIPDAVFFIEGASLPLASPTLMQLPEAGATPFSNVLAISGYVATGTPTLGVSELDHAQKATSTGPGQFTWTTIRTTGPMWTAQTTADLNADARAEIVAFAPEGANPADVCVLDVNAGSSQCVDTPFGMDSVAGIAVGPVVALNQKDVVLTHVNPGNPSMTATFVVPNLRLTGTLASDPASQPAMFPVMDPFLALAQLDAAGVEIIIMGRNGNVVCARSNGAAPPVLCTQ